MKVYDKIQKVFNHRALNGASTNANGMKSLDQSFACLKLRRFLYLISPNKIYNNFYKDLDKVLSSKKSKVFSVET